MPVRCFTYGRPAGAGPVAFCVVLPLGPGFVTLCQTFVRRCQSRAVSNGPAKGQPGPPLAGHLTILQHENAARGIRAAFSNRARLQQSLRIPCAHSISLCEGVVSSFGKSGFTRSRWQREPSSPQTDWTLSQGWHLPSGPRSPGPPRVPHSALAMDGNAMMRAAVRVRILVR